MLPKYSVKEHRYKVFHGIPPSAEGGIKSYYVIFGDMRTENDTFHDGRDDLCAGNRVPSVMSSALSEKTKPFSTNVPRQLYAAGDFSFE